MFVKFLCFLLDIIQQVRKVSLVFHRDDSTITLVSGMISTLTPSLDAFKIISGQHLRSFEQLDGADFSFNDASLSKKICDDNSFDTTKDTNWTNKTVYQQQIFNLQRGPSFKGTSMYNRTTALAPWQNGPSCVQWRTLGLPKGSLCFYLTYTHSCFL